MSGNLHLKQTSFAGIAEALGILYLSGATHKDLQGFINHSVSSGRVAGGVIIDDTDGTITVTAGHGFIKISETEADEETYFFDWPESTVVPLVNGEVNYIYVEYNSGTPRVWSTTTRSDIRLTDMFTLGRVYKEDGTLHVMNAGVSLVNHIREQHERLVAVHWIERAGGGVVSEPAALKLKTTDGKFYVGSNSLSTAGKDTSVADTFDAWYRDGSGGWTNELGETDVNIEQYDDGDGGLEDIPVGKYSARYIYIDFDGHIHVQYGQQGDKLGVIQIEPVPAPPAFLNEFAILAARVIVKDGVSPILEVASAYDKMFVYEGITEHADLAEVSPDDHHDFPALLASAVSDHEYGLWTPDLRFGGNSVDMTYNWYHGTYIKIGKLVHITARFALTNKGSSGGSARIYGLPFPSINVQSGYTPSSFEFNNITFADYFTSFINKGEAYMSLYEVSKAGVLSAIESGNFANNSDIALSCSYFVNGEEEE